jgi:hypothetical protein
VSRAERALLVATLAWAAHRALFPLSETDLFFHLKLGEIILATHHVPLRNLFSFTYPQYPDPDLAWAFQVTMALAHRAGGFAAIVLFKTAATVAAAALAWRNARARGASPTATMLALVMVIEAMRPRLVERPHLVTFVGLGVLVLLLDEPRRWKWLPLLALGWAQFHAGVFFCPLIVLLFAVGAWLDRAALPWRRLLVLLPLIVICTQLTPAGTRLARYLLWHTGLGATRIIDEFRHADAWNDPWFFVLMALALATAIALREPWRRLLPVILVALLAWRSVRFVAEWALLAAPLVAAGITRALAAHVPRHARVGLAGAAALLGVIAVERVATPDPPRLADDVVPFDAIDFVTETGLRRRMFHDLDVGCYLAWQGWPRWQVFEDARLPAYPDELHRALDDTAQSPAAFDRLLRRFDVDAALIVEPGINRRSSAFAPDEWALVWRRPSALVFARRTPEHAGLIARYEIPLEIAFDWQTGSRVLPLATPPARSPVPRCEWDRRLIRALDGEADFDRALLARVDAVAQRCLSPREEAEVRFEQASHWQRAGQIDRARAEYDRVLALAPDHAAALVNRAWAELPREPDAARADFTRARGLAPARAVEIDAALARLPPLNDVNHAP